MSMLKRTKSFLGIFLIVYGICVLLPLAIALAEGETPSAKAFCVTEIVIIVLALICNTKNKVDVNRQDLRMRDSYFIVAAIWIMASAIGAIPYFLSGSLPNFVDALFETASGFSGTGASVMEDIEIMPRSILMWRALTQWLGGMGIVVLVLTILPHYGAKGFNVASAETPGPTSTKLTSRFTNTAQELYLLYIALTVLMIVILCIEGVSLYDATAQAFTTLATGGFSTYNDSIAAFNSTAVTWTFTLFMFIGGTNFNLMIIGLKGEGLKAFKDDEFKFYVKYLFLAIVIATVAVLLNGNYTSFFDALTDASFQITSIITSTGFTITDYNGWPALCHVIMLIGMFTGASSSSTSGGLKLVRVQAMFRMFKRDVKMKLHGNIIEDVKYNSEKVDPNVWSYIVAFVSMFFFVLFTGTFLISIRGDGDFYTNFVATLSCISNIGAGLEGVGPGHNFAFYGNLEKIVLFFIMIAGRLELVTIAVLFSRHFWNPHKA